jgi:hypothetical protein
MDRETAIRAIEACQQMTGREQVVCRPMQINVPDGPEGAVLTDCERCGRKCWKLAIEPDPLPDGVTAACTDCALRAAISR